MNPLFPGINPEPIEPHIEMLRQTVLKESCHAGLATDGDADRIGAIAEDGSFVDSHKCFAVLSALGAGAEKWPGDVVRAFNTTGMVDRIAARYGRKLIECPIGFKYIADLMMEHEIVMGGEESGGIGYSRYLPERDGTLNCLLLANVMAEEGKPLGQLVADLQREFGPHYYGRRDLHITEDMKQARSSGRVPTRPTILAATPLKEGRARRSQVLPRCRPKNGNGAEPWVLFRMSGTEPLLRVYAETASPELVSEDSAQRRRFVRAPLRRTRH